MCSVLLHVLSNSPRQVSALGLIPEISHTPHYSCLSGNLDQHIFSREVQCHLHLKRKRKPRMSCWLVEDGPRKLAAEAESPDLMSQVRPRESASPEAT